MKANKDKFLKLVTKTSPQTSKKNKERIKNREWLRVSREIAFNMLDRLQELKLTQKDLANRLNVTPAYVSKLLRGKQNLTLENILKIQKALDMPILAQEYTKCGYKTEVFSSESLSKVIDMEKTITSGYTKKFQYKTTQALTVTHSIFTETVNHVC